jgi:hypothetical protein
VAHLGVVVGRLDALHLGEGPQRRPQLEQVAGQAARALVLGSLASTALEEWLQLVSEGRHPLDQPGAIALSLEIIPGREEVPRDLEPRLTESLSGLEPFALGGEVAD